MSVNKCLKICVRICVGNIDRQLSEKQVSKIPHTSLMLLPKEWKLYAQILILVNLRLVNFIVFWS